MELYSLCGDFHGYLCGVELGLCGLEAVLLLGGLGHGCLVHQKLRGLYLGGHVSQLELGVLQGGDGLAELLPLLGVGDGPLQSALRDAQSLCSDTDTSAVQGMHGNLEALAQLAQHVLLGNAAVREDQLVCRGSADTHLLLLGAESEARGSLLHDEGGDFFDFSASLLDGAGHGENDIYVSFLAVGDEDLGAVDDVVVSVRHGLGLLALSVRACAGLGEAECAQLLTLCKGNQVFLLLLLCAECLYGIAAQGGVCGYDDACGAAYLGELLHAHHIGQGVAALSAVLLGNGDAQEAVLRHLAGSLSGEFLGLIHLLSQGLHFLFGKLPEQRARHFMFFAQRKIHDSHSSIYSLKIIASQCTHNGRNRPPEAGRSNSA